MDPLIGDFIDEVQQNIERQVKGKSVVQGKEVKYVPQQKLVYWISTSYQNNGKLRNVYQQIYRSYRDKIFKLGKEVSQITKEITGRPVTSAAKDIWHLEHANLEGISESQVSDALAQALTTQNTKEELVGEADLRQFLQNKILLF